MKVAHEGQLMLSIGALLAAEREKRGIPVERAAKETRMRPQRIRDMEADDLSHFTNPSYARMFLIAYAKYLGIPMQTIHEHLPDRGEPGSEGYQYIHASSEDLPSLRPELGNRPMKRGGGLRWLFILIAVVILAGAGVLVTYLVVNLNRLTTAVDKPQPAPAASASPSPTATPTPTPANIGITDLVPAAEPAAKLDETIQLSAPAASPAASPATGIPANPEPSPAASAQPAPSAAEDDRAFLLGTSPEQSPPAAH
jgi:cytoskeletal protein RodZ